MGGRIAAAAGGTWLFKSDPDTFGWSELLASPDRTTCWDGVRNYQARNYLRDAVERGDRVLFYHSQSERAVVGIATVVRAGYPDPTQFDPTEKGYDPKSRSDAPRWYAVDIRADRALESAVTLDALRERPELTEMLLLKRGNRLSLFPVTAAEFEVVLAMERA